MTSATAAAAGWLRSLPTVAAVGRLVESEYGFAVTRAVLVRSFTNDVYKVDAGGRSFALKIYGVGRWTDDEVRWEQQLVRHLTNAGLPVAADVALRGGDSVGCLDAPEGRRPFAMAEWVPGTKPQPPWTEGLYRAVGSELARFHAAADRFHSEHPRHGVRTGDEIREVCDVLDVGSPQQLLVRSVGTEAQRQLTRLSELGLPWGIRHGDPSLDNLNVDGAGLYLYDFDLAAPGWQLEDLTGALATDFAAAFLSGYTEARPLSTIELEALPWLRIISIIENLRFHLIGKPAIVGTHSLTEGWVDSGFESLTTIAAQLGLVDPKARPAGPLLAHSEAQHGHGA